MMKSAAIGMLICFGMAFGCSNPSSNSQAITPAVSGNEQPNMAITLLDNSVVNIQDLSGKNVLIFFQPDCDHCQREATDIKSNLNAFANSTLYFVTAASMQEIGKFANDYQLAGHSNIHFAFTPAKNILDHYGPIAAPSIYIYSNEHKLVKSFNGEVAIDKVLEYL